MKNLMKLFMVAVVYTMATSSFAQTQKGNIVLSGGTGLQFISSNVKYIYDGKTDGEYRTSSLSFTPSIAYFIADDLAIGLSSVFSVTTHKQEDGDKNISNSITILPTVLYYFPIEGKIRPIAQIAAGLYSQTHKYIPKSGSDNKSSASGIALNVGGGIAYFIKENISLNFGLSYTMVNLTESDDNKVKMKQGNFGSNVGISVYF